MGVDSTVDIIIKATDKATATIRHIEGTLKGLGGASGQVGGVLGTVMNLFSGGLTSAGTVLNLLVGGLKFLGSVAGKVFSAIGNSIKWVIGKVEDWGKKLLWVGGILAGVAAALAYKVGGSVLALGGWAQQARTALATMLGSAKESAEWFGKFRQMGFEMPFTFKGIVGGARQLMAYGFKIGEVPRLLTALSDATAAFGGNQDMFDRIVMAIGQMRTMGFPSGQEMRQLAQAGIPAWEMLAQAIGKTSSEAMKLAENRATPAAVAIEALIGGMERRFGGLSKVMMQTLPGALTNLVDVLQMAGMKLGEVLAPTATKLVLGLTNALWNLTNSGVLDKIGNSIAGWFSAANVGKAIDFFGKLYGYATQGVKWLLGLGASIYKWVRSSIRVFKVWGKAIWQAMGDAVGGISLFLQGLFHSQEGMATTSNWINTVIALVQSAAQWFKDWGYVLGNFTSIVLEGLVRGLIVAVATLDSFIFTISELGEAYIAVPKWAKLGGPLTSAPFMYDAITNPTDKMVAMAGKFTSRFKTYDSMLSQPFGSLLAGGLAPGGPGLPPLPSLSLPKFEAGTPSWLSGVKSTFADAMKMNIDPLANIMDKSKNTLGQIEQNTSGFSSDLKNMLDRIYGGADFSRSVITRLRFGGAGSTAADADYAARRRVNQRDHVKVSIDVTGATKELKAMMEGVASESARQLLVALGIPSTVVSPVTRGSLA